MKHDRIRELEDHCEALENALEQIRTVNVRSEADLAGSEAARQAREKRPAVARRP